MLPAHLSGQMKSAKIKSSGCVFKFGRSKNLESTKFHRKTKQPAKGFRMIYGSNNFGALPYSRYWTVGPVLEFHLHKQSSRHVQVYDTQMKPPQDIPQFKTPG